MSAKPTPGPMEIVKDRITHSYDVVMPGTRPRQCIATFWADRSREETATQAEANARAWVDGMEATRKLEILRDAFYSAPYDPVACLERIRKILDEAKT